MLVLVTYDVNIEDKAGRARLRKVAKTCVDYGQRVQNSVFECDLDPGQLEAMRLRILDIMDMSKDSVRFYNLGRNYRSRIEHYGAKASYMPDDAFIV